MPIILPPYYLQMYAVISAMFVLISLLFIVLYAQLLRLNPTSNARGWFIFVIFLWSFFALYFSYIFVRDVMRSLSNK